MRYSRNHLNFTCFWAARDGKPSCAEWLDGCSNVEPDHMCFTVAQASTEWFASERLVHSAVEHDWLCGTWPLPLGIQAYLDWRTERVAWGWSDFLPKPCWPTPLVSQSDAWLGLAGWRTTDAGTAWLLGLTELTLVSDDLLYQQWWKLAEPVVLMEAHARTRADLDALTKAVGPLLDWYNKTLLGKTFRTGKGGPTPKWFTQDECRADVIGAIRYFLGQNSARLQEDVAAYLGFSVSGLYKAMTCTHHLDWKTLVAEAKARK